MVDLSDKLILNVRPMQPQQLKGINIYRDAISFDPRGGGHVTAAQQGAG